mmetsp:Transcript_23085/g.37082  ORF Transcript_23085/g.37082 Transcript_23085/m.37082 type:complete len:95 (-) Transcript_23085:1161-1445(-)
MRRDIRNVGSNITMRLYLGATSIREKPSSSGSSFKREECQRGRGRGGARGRKQRLHQGLYVLLLGGRFSECSEIIFLITRGWGGKVWCCDVILC